MVFLQHQRGDRFRFWFGDQPFDRFVDDHGNVVKSHRQQHVHSDQCGSVFDCHNPSQFTGFSRYAESVHGHGNIFRSKHEGYYWICHLEFLEPDVASINGGELVTALALGSLTISATSNSITGSTSVTVQSSTLTSITIVPANGSIAFSTTEQFHALGNYSDGSVQNTTRQVTWASSNTAVVQIVSGGMSRGLTPGTTTISATLGMSLDQPHSPLRMPRSCPLL